MREEPELTWKATGQSSQLRVSFLGGEVKLVWLRELPLGHLEEGREWELPQESGDW